MKLLSLHHNNTACLLHVHTQMQSQQYKEHWVNSHVRTSGWFLTLTSIITREKIKKGARTDQPKFFL